MKIPTNERKAISPIVATVLIVAATLIAFAAVAGYVFGIFGSASNTANVSVTSAQITSGGTGTGTVKLLNSGTAATSSTDVSITYAGHTCTSGAVGGFTLGGTGVIAAGNGVQTLTLTPAAGGVYCAGAAAPTAGVAFTGYVVLSNSEQATFTGTFS